MTTPTHPGLLLKKWYFEPFRLNKTKVAADLGMSRSMLHLILAGTNPIHTDAALRFEEALGVSAEKLMHAQAEYDLWEARQARGQRVAQPILQIQQMSLAMR